MAKDDKAFMASLEDDSAPFLITTDQNALNKVENDAIFLSVKGKIYAFQSPAAYRANGSLYSLSVYLSSSPF